MRYFSVLAVTLLLNMGVYTVMAQDKPAVAGELQVETPEIQKHLDKNLPKLRSRENREAAIREIQQELSKMANIQRKYPTADDRRRLSRELVDLYRNTRDADFKERGRLEILSLMTKFGDNEVAKPFILRTLDSGTKLEREEILRVIGAPSGIGGDDVYNKISDLARQGTIQAESRTTLLVRINKSKALPEALRELETATNKKIFVHSAAALQNYYNDPSNYSKIIPGLLRRGLQKEDSYDKGNGLFWINADLFAQYVQASAGISLEQALEVLEADSVLCKPTLIPTLIRHLDSPKSKVRILAARALMKASAHDGADHAAIKTAIYEALAREQSPEVKVVLESLVRRFKRRESTRK